jgi:hypothetical protein
VDFADTIGPAKSRHTGRTERRFKHVMWTTRRSGAYRAGSWTHGEANPRFVVTSRGRHECKAKYLYEKVLYEETSVKRY